MKRFLLFLLPSLAFAQSPCPLDVQYQVLAPSGLRMRAEPDLKAKPVAAVPKDSLVWGCSDVFGDLQVEGISGHWRKVSYHGQEGYMFDGFLKTVTYKKETPVEELARDEKTEPARIAEKPEETEKPREVIKPLGSTEIKMQIATEALNYCGDIAVLDPGLKWYGIYHNPETQRYSLKPVDLEIVLSQYKLGNEMEFDIRTGNETPALFLIGANRALTAGEVVELRDSYWQYNPRILFPGQRLEVYPDLPGKGPNNIQITAVGSVEEAGDCPELKDYRIQVTGKQGVLNIKQDITGGFTYLGKCGIPEVHWFGDLNQDGRPDVVFISPGEEKNVYTLFLSTDKADALLERSAVWTLKKCY